MNLYLISQSVNEDWDTYDSAIVCANTAKEARLIHPGIENWNGKQGGSTWCMPRDVKSERIGKPLKGTKKGIILASFNAG